MNRIEILKGFLEENPKDSFSRYALALEYVKLGQNDDAVQEFETSKVVATATGAKKKAPKAKKAEKEE